jgi:ferredoxin-NADP reductase
LGTPLQIRVGGRFVYPPPDLSEKEVQGIRRIVFVAGGVGINPIMSMLEHLHLISRLNPAWIRLIRLLYGTRTRSGEAVLFYERIGQILQEHMNGRPTEAATDGDYRATMYLTGTTYWSPHDVIEYERLEATHIDNKYRRISPADLLEALGPVAERNSALAYVCGLPSMTDEFVEVLSGADGMDPKRVHCEKWW